MKNTHLEIRPNEEPTDPWIKMADLEQSSLQKKYFLQLLLGIENFVSEMLSLICLEKKRGQASK